MCVYIAVLRGEEWLLGLSFGKGGFERLDNFVDVAAGVIGDGDTLGTWVQLILYVK